MAAFSVAYLDRPNRASSALPCTKVVSGAATANLITGSSKQERGVALKSGDRVREIRGWTSGLGRRREAVEAAGVEVGHVHVRGLRLRYAQSKGFGEPLLFCNGIGANFELLLPFVRAMTGRRVICFDVPGTGGSQASWFWPSFPAYARFAVGILDQLGHQGSFAVPACPGEAGSRSRSRTIMKRA